MSSVSEACNTNGIISKSLNIGKENWDHPTHLAYSQLHMNRMMPVRSLQPSEESIPLPRAKQLLDLESLAFTDPLNAKPIGADQFLNRRLYNDALLIFHRGEVVHESYRNGMTAEDHHVLHSTTKSLVAMLVGIAIGEGKMTPEALISDYIPELADIVEWRSVTLQHVLDMAIDSDYAENYDDPECSYFSYARAVGYYPGSEGESLCGARGWLQKPEMKPQGVSGKCFNYTSPLTNALMIAVSEVYEESAISLLERKVFKRIGAKSEGWLNTDHLGVPIVEGQLSLKMEDFARWSALMINNGRNLKNEQIIPIQFIEDTLAPRSTSRNAFLNSHYAELLPRGHYRNQFWVVDAEQKQYAMLGIHGQFVWFDHDRELMVCGFSSYPTQVDKIMNDTLQQLWEVIAAACDCR